MCFSSTQVLCIFRSNLGKVLWRITMASAQHIARVAFNPLSPFTQHDLQQPWIELLPDAVKGIILKHLVKNCEPEVMSVIRRSDIVHNLLASAYGRSPNCMAFVFVFSGATPATKHKLLSVLHERIRQSRHVPSMYVAALMACSDTPELQAHFHDIMPSHRQRYAVRGIMPKLMQIEPNFLVLEVLVRESTYAVMAARNTYAASRVQMLLFDAIRFIHHAITDHTPYGHPTTALELHAVRSDSIRVLRTGRTVLYMIMLLLARGASLQHAHTDETLQFVRRCCILLCDMFKACYKHHSYTLPAGMFCFDSINTLLLLFPNNVYIRELTETMLDVNERRLYNSIVQLRALPNGVSKLVTMFWIWTMRGKFDLHRSAVTGAILRLMFLVQPKKFVAVVTQALTALGPLTHSIQCTVCVLRKMASPNTCLFKCMLQACDREERVILCDRWIQYSIPFPTVADMSLQRSLLRALNTQQLEKLVRAWQPSIIAAAYSDFAIACMQALHSLDALCATTHIEFWDATPHNVLAAAQPHPQLTAIQTLAHSAMHTVNSDVCLSSSRTHHTYRATLCTHSWHVFAMRRRRVYALPVSQGDLTPAMQVARLALQTLALPPANVLVTVAWKQRRNTIFPLQAMASFVVQNQGDTVRQLDLYLDDFGSGTVHAQVLKVTWNGECSTYEPFITNPANILQNNRFSSTFLTHFGQGIDVAWMMQAPMPHFFTS